MSTHNICFHQEIRKILILFGCIKRLIKSYENLNKSILLSVDVTKNWMSGEQYRS